MSIIIQGNTIVQGSVVVGNQLLLDVYSGAAAAYSLRKLSSTYSGSAIRVRRSSDNTEQDIGFDANGNLDETALTTFVGAGNGFVTTWYDQSRNNRNSTQTTQASQPRIVNAGVIDKQNNKPCVRYDGTDDYTFNVSTYDRANNTIALVGNYRTTTGTQFIYCIEPDPSRNYPAILINPNLYYGYRNSATAFNLGAANTNQFLLFASTDSTNLNVFKDNVSYGTSAKDGGTGNFVNNIGSYRNLTPVNTDYAAVNVQEIIFWNNSKLTDRVGIQNNINAYYNIYWQGNGQALLDQYPSAAAAYSVRALSSTYTGALIRVRRSSDNAEQDIYALYDGSLDEASLTAFCGAGNGFITTWYDQSGNSNNLRQTTGADQPYIVLSGSIVKRNNKPYIVSLTNNTLAFTSEISSGIYSLWMTYEKSALGNLTVLLKDANSYHWLDYGLNQYVGNATINLITISSIYNQNVLYLHNTLRKVSSVSEIYRNGLLIGSANLGGSTANSTFFAPKSKAAAIICSELVLYNNDQTSNRVGIQNNINSYFTIY